MALFRRGNFKLHSGQQSGWKVDCDALVDEDWVTAAWMISRKLTFSRVIGIPTGGLRLAYFLSEYTSRTGPTLIVDDVFTTGGSMEEARQKVHGPCIGYVVFARGKRPDWVHCLCDMGKVDQCQAERRVMKTPYDKPIASVPDTFVLKHMQEAYRKGYEAALSHVVSEEEILKAMNRAGSLDFIKLAEAVHALQLRQPDVVSVEEIGAAFLGREITHHDYCCLALGVRYALNRIHALQLRPRLEREWLETVILRTAPDMSYSMANLLVDAIIKGADNG